MSFYSAQGWLGIIGFLGMNQTIENWQLLVGLEPLKSWELFPRMTTVELLLYTDNLCKQFEFRSGPTKCQAWSAFKLFDTSDIPEIIFWKKFFWRNQQLTKNYFPITMTCHSTDNFWKQFRFRSGAQKHQAWSGFKLFDTSCILERIFKKKSFWRNLQLTKKHARQNYPPIVIIVCILIEL